MAGIAAISASASGGPLAARRAEALERPGAALALGARAQARQRGADLSLVGAGDQVGGLDRARIASQPSAAECIRTPGRCYSGVSHRLGSPRHASLVAGAAVPVAGGRRGAVECGGRRGRGRSWWSSGRWSWFRPPALGRDVWSSCRRRRRRRFPIPAPTPRAIAVATAARRFIALLPVACRSRAAYPTAPVVRRGAGPAPGTAVKRLPIRMPSA